MPTPLEEMRIVARRLQPLNIPFVFVGGAVMCLLVDYPQLTQFRRTKDVDVVVEVVKDLAASAVEARNFITSECAKLLKNPYFSEAVLEHLPRMLGAKERAAIVLERFRNMSLLLGL